MLNFIYLFLCYLLDTVISFITYNGFSYQSFIFVPSFLFLGSLILFKNSDFYSGFFKIFLIGIFSDIMLLNPIFAYTISFLVAYVLLKVWTSNFGDSIIETIILFTILVFVKEIIIYSLYSIIGYINMPFDIFMFNRCIVSTLLNILSIIVLSFFVEVKNNYDNQKEVIRKSRESLFSQRFNN